MEPLCDRCGHTEYQHGRGTGGWGTTTSCLACKACSCYVNYVKFTHDEEGQPMHEFAGGIRHEPISELDEELRYAPSPEGLGKDKMDELYGAFVNRDPRFFHLFGEQMERMSKEFFRTGFSPREGTDYSFPLFNQTDYTDTGNWTSSYEEPEGRVSDLDDREEGAKAYESYIDTLEEEKSALEIRLDRAYEAVKRFEEEKTVAERERVMAEQRLERAYSVGQEEQDRASELKSELVSSANRVAELEDALDGLVKAIDSNDRYATTKARKYAVEVLKSYTEDTDDTGW